MTAVPAGSNARGVVGGRRAVDGGRGTAARPVAGRAAGRVRAGGGERGSVGLLAVLSSLVVLTAGLFVLALATDLGVTAARARTAADAAALAGAGSAPLVGGDGDACAAATRAAAANGATVTRCRALRGAAGVEVAVAVAPRSPLLRPLTGPVPARAAAALRPPR